MRTLNELIKKSLRQETLILAGALGLTAVLVNLDFNMLEASLYDLRVSHGVQSRPHADIVIVSLDDETTRALDEFSPLPLDAHAQALEALEKLSPRAVGYLVDLNQVNQANPELLHTPWSGRFVEAANRMTGRGIPVLLGTPYDVTGEVLPPYPLSTLPHAIAVIHKDGNVFAEDKVTRRALTYLNDKPVFHLALAQRLGLVGPRHRPRGSFRVPEIDGDYFFFRYHGDTVVEDPKSPAIKRVRGFGRPGRQNLPYERIPFIDVLNGNIPADALKDKIVLVGTLSREDSSDFAITPYSRSAFASPKLVVHATILDSIIRDDGLIRAPTWANWLTTFAVAFFVLWWVLNSTPLNGVFSTLGLGVAVLAAGQLLFQVNGLWLRESQPLVGIFVGYYLVVPYRLIREYKKRWDYQKKNELLTQVEEMKTNFVYLVTHDLKTPVARIQGLAEVLLRKASERLIDRDRQTIASIMLATDELNRFITSILELSKVESNRLQLHFESKDINQLIERSVEGFRAQARSRRIQIHVNLEPLFAVRIDAGLIAKVINNLIDNAIKYSPSPSEIFVESREVDEWIEISVRDRGIGMSEEERQSLFTRFYRAKNDTTTQITGTGLGLYLTKYFIEAHGGRVEVASEQGVGSTFRIFLPVAGSSAASAERRASPRGPAEPGLTRRIFGGFGFSAKSAVKNGEGKLSLANAPDVEAVVADKEQADA